MKRTIPTIITFATGVVMLVAYFIPYAQSWEETLELWFTIVSTIAMFLGAANLLKVHLRKMSDRNPGWGYSAVTLTAFFITIACGLGKIGVEPSPKSPNVAWSGQFDAEGTPFWWLFEYGFKPLSATIFALLAFYVASASFRAFRAKNFEATLLLSSAFIVLLGRTYLGTLLSEPLPEALSGLRLDNLTTTIMKVFVTAGNRAIMIGIALGVTSTSIRIILGMDRSHLGSDEE